VVEGDAIRLANFLSQEYGGRVVTHSRFGTAKWQIKEIAETLSKQLAESSNLNTAEFPDALDFISARTEFYEYPTALPTVERSSIKLDLHRRDFTINTMALRLNGRHHGELYDFWGGLADLRQKRIRVLHSLSFVDDPTRMLRAARFEQRFHFRIESRTLELIKQASDLLRQVSGDRIRHEINLIFQEDDPPAVFRRLEELNLLESIFPGLHWGKDQTKDWDNLINHLKLTHRKEKTIPAEFCWLVLFHTFNSSQMASICQRLKLPSSFCRILESSANVQSRLPELESLSIVEIVNYLDNQPETALVAAAAFNSDNPGGEIIMKYLTTWRHIHPTINGRNLEKLGIPRGPYYRTILDTLRAAWLNGEIKNKVEENMLLSTLIQRYE